MTCMELMGPAGTDDAGRAIASDQNVTVPSGLLKFGSLHYIVRLNSSSEAIEAINSIPIEFVNGAPILLRDVAHVRRCSPAAEHRLRRRLEVSAAPRAQQRKCVDSK